MAKTRREDAQTVGELLERLAVEIDELNTKWDGLYAGAAAQREEMAQVENWIRMRQAAIRLLASLSPETPIPLEVP